MTKPLSIISHNKYNRSANEILEMFLTSKLIICFIDGLTLKKEVPINCWLITQWKWTYILDFGPWRWSALNMDYMEKWPSILLKDNRHEVKIWVFMDNRSEGQHHGIKEILLKGNCYFIEVADIKEERHLRRGVGQHCPNRVGRDAKSFGGQRRWWASPTFVTPDRAHWGLFSVCHPFGTGDSIPCMTFKHITLLSNVRSFMWVPII